MIDRSPISLRAEDRSVDAADAQEWAIRLADHLRAVDVALSALIDSLSSTHDLIDGLHRAKRWGNDAREALDSAMHAREKLAIEQRVLGLLPAASSSPPQWAPPRLMRR